MRRADLFITAAVLALAAEAASANDSSAELTTGGLVFGKDANIAMRSEALAISESEIVVRYRFFNTSPRDKTVTVAFPMPDVMREDSDANIAIPEPDAANFLALHTTVDGTPVQAESDQKAIVRGADVSDRLKALRVPLALPARSDYAPLDRRPRTEQERLVAHGVARVDEYDVGKGMERHLDPAWTFRSTFYWRQNFPAGREIAVEHRYKPSVGATTGTALEFSPLDRATRADYERRYCIDHDFLASVASARARARAHGRSAFFEQRIAYVLTTGANWAGPIGDFRLTIDKGAPDSLVSFCADGVRKTGPTTFEVRHEDFTPTRDLDILILSRPKS